MEKNFVQDSFYENRFWLEILKDHTTFMLSSLTPMEKDNLRITESYMINFSEQLKKVQRLPEGHHNEARLQEINDESYRLALEFISYQQGLLEKKLKYEVMLNFTPTFLEHMIREGKEFLRQLRHLKARKKPVPAKISLHQNKLWLPDAAGHASYIQGALDMTEKELIGLARSYQTDFEGLFLKSYELKDMLQLEYPDLPVVMHLDEQCSSKMKGFICYLNTLLHLLKEKKMMSMLTPLVPDHMLREEEYYLRKLKEAHPKLEI